MAKPAPRKGRDAAPARPPRLPPTPEQLDAARRLRWAVVHVVVAALLVASIAWAVVSVKGSIARRTAGGPPAVVFVNRPVWMTDVVSKQIAASFRPPVSPSVFDREALVEVNRRLAANPWVAKVKQVRRVFDAAAGDTIEVDCDFRAPAALVSNGSGDYWFVDAKGVKLPERFGRAELPQIIFANGRVNLRVVDGVAAPPPADAGKLWPGDDLQAGLDMAGRLNGVPFAEEILTVDVSNYNGRRSDRGPQVVLVTKYDTQVWWGRPWIAADAFIEVRPEVKLETMKQTVKQFGRVDANRKWIDLRFDNGYMSPDYRAGYMEPQKRDMRRPEQADGGR